MFLETESSPSSRVHKCWTLSAVVGCLNMSAAVDHYSPVITNASILKNEAEWSKKQ